MPCDNKQCDHCVHLQHRMCTAGAAATQQVFNVHAPVSMQPAVYAGPCAQRVDHLLALHAPGHPTCLEFTDPMLLYI